MRTAPRKPAGISLCMIVKNEERFLERCLRSVAGIVDEINIVDTGSTDGTIEIARRFGARLEHHPWRDDFAWARNKSLEMATKRWILQLDADEELLPESRAELQALKVRPAQTSAVLVRCINASGNSASSGVVSHAIVRIFPNDPRIRFRGRIHEFPAIDGAQTTIAAQPSGIKIKHYGYLDDVIADRGKFERNFKMIQAGVEAEPDEPYNWYNLGITAHAGGDQPRAAQALERMWELCERHGLRIFAGNGLQMLSTIYTEHLGDARKGLLYAQACLKIAPHYGNAHFAAGKAYAALGDQPAARAMYLQAIEDAAFIERQYVVDEDACGWKPMCEIASTYDAQGEAAAALTWLEKALAAKPQMRVLHVRRALILEKLERFDEAEREYAALHDSYGDEQSALGLANFLLRRDDPRAARVLDDARGLIPDVTNVLRALEERYRSRGDFSAALDAAQRALGSEPGDGVLHYNAAIDCLNLGRKTEALGHLECIGAGSEAAARAAYLRAVLLREFERLDEALSALDSLLETQPAQIDAMLLRAAVLDALGRKGDAETVFLQAMPLAKRRAAVELAGFYLREGRPLDAKRIAEEALAS